MSKLMVKKLTPALIGLGSLLVYILACTSFSPDDSKVLYVTADPVSGMTGISVYDRKSHKSELLFEPFTRDGDNLSAKAVLLRPQWVDGGHSFLTTWRASADEDTQPLNLAVLPFDRRSPARVFQIPVMKDGGAAFYYWPVPVAGKSAFLMCSNGLIRLNLETGAMRRQTNEQQIIPLPAPDNDALFYASGGNKSNASAEVGLLNPETFARTPLFTNVDAKMDLLSMALNRNAGKLAYQNENGNPLEVHLLETGKPARVLSLASLGEKTIVNVRQFSPKGDVLYAAYKTTDAHTNAEYGFVEIPLDGSSVRKTTLITGALANDNDLFAAFQIDISHDGRTLAVESLWLAFGDEPLKADDCALFLVDLSKPEHKITKVPIPLPSRERPSPFKK